MSLDRDIETIRKFQKDRILTVLGGDGFTLAENQMASNAIDNILNELELLNVQARRSALCYLHEQDGKPVFVKAKDWSEREDWSKNRRWKGQPSIPLFAIPLGVEPNRPWTVPAAWLYTDEKGDEQFTLDASRTLKFKDGPPIPLYQDRAVPPL